MLFPLMQSHSVQAGEYPSTKPVFEAEFRDMDWQYQSLDQYKGDFLVLYFWASWCGPCRHEVPHLIKLYDQYRDRNLQIVGIAIDNADDVAAFAEEFGINYPLLLGGQEGIELAEKLGNTVGGVPFTVVINPEGEIVDTLLGKTPEGKLANILKPLLD